MKITAIETLRTEEFGNVLWVRVHTDAGMIGLGETFYGAGAVEAHLHDTLAARILGRDPLRVVRAPARLARPSLAVGDVRLGLAAVWVDNPSPRCDRPQR